jgi:hypothetical protein
VRSENGDLAGKIIEVDDLRGRKLACHVGENGQSAALLSKPSVPNAVEVLILWKSGAIGEEIVPLTGRNRN